jgi:TetR/AcrR family transcriptional regulator, ethionamide resistance regulator
MAGSDQTLDTVSRWSRQYAAAVASGQPRHAAPTAKRAAVQGAVLKATEDLLAEGASYADLNIERIANRAGISRTAFYFYFRDKRELLMRLTEDVNELLFQQADIWFSGEGDPEPEMREALTNIAALYGEHGVLLRALVEVATYDEEVARFWQGLVGRFVEATRRRIEAEQRAGRAAPEHADATAFALCWMTERALYQQFVQDEPPPGAELVDALAGVWLRSVYRP